MNSDNVFRHDIEQLEGWLKDYPDPQPLATTLDRIKMMIHAELESHPTTIDDTPIPSQEFIAGIKKNIRRELLLSQSSPNLRQWTWSWVGGISAAAVILLMMASFSIPVSQTGNKPDLASLDWTMAMNSDLRSLESDIADLEWQLDVAEYVRQNPSQEPAQILADYQDMIQSDIWIDFTTDSNS